MNRQTHVRWRIQRKQQNKKNGLKRERKNRNEVKMRDCLFERAAFFSKNTLLPMDIRMFLNILAIEFEFGWAYTSCGVVCREG